MSYISDFKSSAQALFKQSYSPLPAYATSSSVGTGAADSTIATGVGQRFSTADGREVVLVRNGTVALAAGVLVQAPAEVTAFEKLAMTVPTSYPATAGQTQIYVTNGATVLKENQFAGGFVQVDSGTGIGQFLRITSHQPAAANASFVVNLEDAIVTTLDATSTITLTANQYDGVIISPATTATGGPVGVSLYPLAASTAATYNATSGALTTAGVAQYGFIQCRGFVSCLVDNSVTNVGYPVGVSKVTAGTVGVATLTTTPQIGVSAQTLTSAHNGLIFLSL